MSENTDAAIKLAATNPNQLVLNELATAIEGLKYGHVALTIHEGRVVQLDVTEKKRFTGN